MMCNKYTLYKHIDNTPSYFVYIVNVHTKCKTSETYNFRKSENIIYFYFKQTHNLNLFRIIEYKHMYNTQQMMTMMMMVMFTRVYMCYVYVNWVWESHTCWINTNWIIYYCFSCIFIKWKSIVGTHHMYIHLEVICCEAMYLSRYALRRRGKKQQRKSSLFLCEYRMS